MNSRERVLAAIDGGKPDRVPLDIWATAEVMANLREHFGAVDDAEVRRRLHIDGFGGCAPRYLGPEQRRFADGSFEDLWGMRYRPVGYGSGEYSEQCFYPLAEATSLADLDAYRWPDPDWFDFSGVRAQCEAQADQVAIMSGYIAPFYYLNKLRGLEQSLLDLALYPELAAAILDRVCDYFYRYHERLYEAADGLIDVSQLTDDLGVQWGLMISEPMFREFLLPHYRRLARLMHDHGIRIFHHDDGAMWELLPALVDDVGIAVLNPVQYRCGPVELAWLKAEFGDRLCFHGGVDNQQVLPFGSVDEVREEVRHCLRELAPGGRYILAPCHNLQAVSPVESIVAMYQTAWEEGWY